MLGATSLMCGDAWATRHGGQANPPSARACIHRQLKDHCRDTGRSRPLHLSAQHHSFQQIAIAAIPRSAPALHRATRAAGHAGAAADFGSSHKPQSQQQWPLFEPSELTEMALVGLLPMPSWAFNLWQTLLLYKEVITRVTVTIAMLAVIRCGLFISLPGIDFGRMPAAEVASHGERLVKALYGQAQVLPASLFELGISPSMNASIILTMLLALPEQLASQFKPLRRLREARKEGRSGQAYLTYWMNTMSLGFAVYLGLLKAVELQPYALAAGPGFLTLTMVSLAAGSAIVQHCANVITAGGIGSGPTLVICCGIISEYSEAMHTVASRLETGTLAPGMSTLLGAVYLAFAMVTVYMSRTELRLPTMQYNRGSAVSGQDVGAMPGDENPFVAARQVVGMGMAKRMARQEHFPLPLSGNGMMSIILAGALWYFALPAGADMLGLTHISSFLFAIQSSWFGLFIYGLIVFGMEFLPLGGINAKEVAEYFSAMNVGIKGVVPGQPTEEYLQQQLLRCKFWGGLTLGFLAVAAHLFDNACQRLLGASLSATSLLIVVGTVIQSSRQMESLLEGPKLAKQLQREQDMIQSLTVI